MELFRALLGTSERSVLLCTDLHFQERIGRQTRAVTDHRSEAVGG